MFENTLSYVKLISDNTDSSKNKPKQNKNSKQGTRLSKIRKRKLKLGIA